MTFRGEITAEHYEQTLRQLPFKDLVIRVGRPWGPTTGLVAVLSSPDFEAIERHERHGIIRDYLVTVYGDRVLRGFRELEPVLTFTPAELAAADRRDDEIAERHRLAAERASAE